MDDAAQKCGVKCGARRCSRLIDARSAIVRQALLFTPVG